MHNLSSFSQADLVRLSLLSVPDRPATMPVRAAKAERRIVDQRGRKGDPS